MSSYSSISTSPVSGPGTVWRNRRTDFGIVGLANLGSAASASLRMKSGKRPGLISYLNITITAIGSCSGSRRGLRALDGLPHPLRRRRHVDVADAVFRQRVDDGVHHRDQRPGASGLAAALDAEWVGLCRYRMMRGDEVRHVGGAGH